MARSLAKAVARQERRTEKRRPSEESPWKQAANQNESPRAGADTSALVPMNQRQREYLEILDLGDQVVVIGPAGTGKTFLAATYAADEFRAKRISKIILTRPNAAAGRSLGFFPGSADEKMANWVRPLVNRIKKRLGESLYEYAVRKGQIQILPFETMRGESWENAFIILDEAQNTTSDEIEMFLTRQGEGSKVVINGDIEQSDISGSSGLGVVIAMIKAGRVAVPMIEFDIEDIVRSGRCKMWVKAFRSHKRGE